MFNHTLIVDTGRALIFTKFIMEDGTSLFKHTHLPFINSSVLLITTSTQKKKSYFNNIKLNMNKKRIPVLISASF